MTKLVLIRHAQSYNNANAIIGGNPDITEKGQNQAHEAGEKIYNLYGDEFDFMVISGMARTNQTAAIINQFLKIEEISYNKALQEKSYGIYEGLDFNEHRPMINSLGYDEMLPGGESDAMVSSRVVKHLCEYFKGEEALGIIVTHCHVIKMATQYFLGKGEHLVNAGFVELDPDNIADLSGKCRIDSYEACSSEECA